MSNYSSLKSFKNLKDEQIQKQLFINLTNKLNIQNPEDWYKVTVQVLQLISELPSKLLILSRISKMRELIDY